MDPKGRDSYSRAYNEWVTTRTPESMAQLVEAFMPTVNAEIMQYSGPKELLRSRGRYLVTQAVKSFNPMSNARLHSWVVTNLKQLSRYGKRLRPVRASEAMLRNAAELASVEKRMEDDLGRKPTDDELTDETGWNKKTIAEIRRSAVASVSGSAFGEDDEGEEGTSDPGLVRPSSVPYAAEAVYMGLDDRDKAIFDGKTGMHGKEQTSGSGLADMLRLTPAAISQRSASIGQQIADMARRA
jgi:DNA-directed RNA polymerase specialized sigma subunit